MKKRLLVACALSVLGAACFPVEGPRFYPEWKRDDHGNAVIASCATIDGWVSKTGKEGLGLVLFLRGTGNQPCLVSITSIELRIENRVHHATRLPAAPTLREGQQVFAWVPFAFDGNEAWNDDEKHHATVVITAAPGSTPIVWPLTMELRERFPCEDAHEIYAVQQ